MYRLLVDFFLRPFSLLSLLTALALVQLWRKREGRRSVLLGATIPFALLMLVSTPAFSYLAVGSLEWACPPSRERPSDAEAIVVLSSGLTYSDNGLQETELDTDSLWRCLHAARLYHGGPPCLLVATGGKSDALPLAPPMAEVMRDFLLTQQIRAADMLLDNRATTTYENAVETAALLHPRGIRKIVLVTTALHLRRAEACFRAQGFEVVPSGCGYYTGGFRWSLGKFLPTASAAAQTEVVLHEWLGILWYRLRGRI